MYTNAILFEFRISNKFSIYYFELINHRNAEKLEMKRQILVVNTQASKTELQRINRNTSSR